MRQHVASCSTAASLCLVLMLGNQCCTIRARVWKNHGKKGGGYYGKKQKKGNKRAKKGGVFNMSTGEKQTKKGGIFNMGKKNTHTRRPNVGAHTIGPYVGGSSSDNVHVVGERTYFKRQTVAGGPFPASQTVQPTVSPMASPTVAPVPQRQSLAKVAAYYYPWWGNDFHRGRPIMRERLDPPQLPKLGKYNDTEPAVIEQHLIWSRQANIQVWIGSWWGPGTREDTTLLDVILPHSNLGDLEIGLIYETKGRVKETEEGSGEFNFENVLPDVEHIADQYFDNPNYLRIGGRPVLFVYVTRFYDKSAGTLATLITLMRQAAASRGHDVFLVGDQVWRDAPDSSDEALAILDGVTNYDVYGNLRTPNDTYAREAGIDLYYTRQEAWRAACQGKCAFFPSLSPGLNKNGKLTPLSRQLDQNSAPGSLLQRMATNAIKLVDDAADRIIVVTSFNEWHEDTQIEPTADAITTVEPANITYGVPYEAYGELYLDILRDATTELM